MKPQDLSLGFRDLIAVFVPGAVLLYAIMAAGKKSLGIPVTNLVPGGDILLFAALAYGLGSVVYAFGAALDFIYDLLEPWLVRGTRRERFACFDILATDAKNSAIEAALPGSKLPALWSNKSFWGDQLRRTCPAASIELDRLEGTQKFFRTFSVVLFLITCYSNWKIHGVAAFAAFSALLICFGFYVAKRAEWSYRLLKWAVLSRI
ncbi:hypothetical protein [Sphingomonas sp. Leaf10]|uniref:hypothetical protein n=1 Tax=Sphingomonas sp. Leaf10 TaxID=1735676 RepID=UPI000AB4AFB5|nr:hypothetical protein [Sphingomonas sp. Leaf10]